MNGKLKVGDKIVCDVAEIQISDRQCHFTASRFNSDWTQSPWILIPDAGPEIPILFRSLSMSNSFKAKIDAVITT